MQLARDQYATINLNDGDLLLDSASEPFQPHDTHLMYQYYSHCLRKLGIDTKRIEQIFKAYSARYYPHNVIEDETEFMESHRNCRAHMTIVATDQMYQWLMRRIDQFYEKHAIEDKSEGNEVRRECESERNRIWAHALRARAPLALKSATIVTNMIKPRKDKIDAIIVKV